MSYNQEKVQAYCKKISDSFGSVECEKHCAIAKICESCEGDFEASIDNVATYTDKAVEILDKDSSDAVANEILLEYYKSQLSAANEEIATLKEMNKILAESIKNLSQK